MRAFSCSCPDWHAHRAGFEPNDARRVCEHLYDKLYATKTERTFDPLLRLFIRYGRTMFAYRVVNDDLGLLLIGQPFGPGVMRAVGIVKDAPIVATYDARIEEWASGETDLSPELATGLLDRMRSAFPATVL